MIDPQSKPILEPVKKVAPENLHFIQDNKDLHKILGTTDLVSLRIDGTVWICASVNILDSDVIDKLNTFCNRRFLQWNIIKHPTKDCLMIRMKNGATKKLTTRSMNPRRATDGELRGFLSNIERFMDTKMEHINQEQLLLHVSSLKLVLDAP